MATEYVDVIETPAMTVEINAGAVADQIFIGPTAPTFTAPGIWIQTGLGPSGQDYTVWFEDGL